MFLDNFVRVYAICEMMSWRCGGQRTRSDDCPFSGDMNPSDARPGALLLPRGEGLMQVASRKARWQTNPARDPRGQGRVPSIAQSACQPNQTMGSTALLNRSKIGGHSNVMQAPARRQGSSRSSRSLVRRALSEIRLRDLAQSRSFVA